MADTWNLRIRKIRLRLDVQQDRLARMIGFSPKTVGRWESGAAPAGVGLMMLRFLMNVVDKHPADTIVRALESANGDMMQIVRILVWLERHPDVPHVVKSKPAPPSSARRPPFSLPSLPPPSSVH